MLGVVRFPEVVSPVPYAGGVHGAAYERAAACPQAIKRGMYGVQYDEKYFFSPLLVWYDVFSGNGIMWDGVVRHGTIPYYATVMYNIGTRHDDVMKYCKVRYKRISCDPWVSVVYVARVHDASEKKALLGILGPV